MSEEEKSKERKGEPVRKFIHELKAHDFHLEKLEEHHLRHGAPQGRRPAPREHER